VSQTRRFYRRRRRELASDWLAGRLDDVGYELAMRDLATFVGGIPAEERS
jgi:hypothetical protein